LCNSRASPSIFPFAWSLSSVSVPVRKWVAFPTPRSLYSTTMVILNQPEFVNENVLAFRRERPFNFTQPYSLQYLIANPSASWTHERSKYQMIFSNYYNNPRDPDICSCTP
jgi:hypothetical protein